MLVWVEEILRNLAVWIYCLITVPSMGLLALVIRRHFWAVLWCEGLLKVLGISVRVINAESLKKLSLNEKYVFMCNHQSQLDIPVLEKVLKPFNIRFLAKKSLFNIPFFGWGIRALGYIPVEREDPKEAFKSILLCIEKLKEGINLVIFPEGTRSPDGSLLPFKTGGFIIPIKSGVKIVPLVLWGTRDILPKGSLWFRLKRKKVWIFICDPVEVKDFTLRDKKKVSEIVRQKIEEGIKIIQNKEAKEEWER